MGSDDQCRSLVYGPTVHLDLVALHHFLENVAVGDVLSLEPELLFLEAVAATALNHTPSENKGLPYPIEQLDSTFDVVGGKPSPNEMLQYDMLSTLIQHKALQRFAGSELEDQEGHH